jgi:hypothetical protein
MMVVRRVLGWQPWPICLPLLSALSALPACSSGSAASAPTPGASDAASSFDGRPSSDAGGKSTDAGTDVTPFAVLPANILDLTNWKLQLPVGDASAEEIMQPELATFTLYPYFVADADAGGVLFEANCGGVTTAGSLYPRSELREMTDAGLVEAAWSLATGTHTMIVTEAITHLPAARPQVVAAQIHDNLSPGVILELRLNTAELFVQGANGANEGILDSNYALGTLYTVKFVVSGGQVQVYYNDMATPKVIFTPPPPTDAGTYFKAGCYTQSNVDAGDLPTAYGQVLVTALQVMHQ